MKTIQIFSLIIALFFHTLLFGQRSHFSGGYYYSTYICNNNDLLTWGDNYYKQLSRDNSEKGYETPHASPYVKNIISIDAGYGAHTLALTKNKHVISWGQNFYGELGAGVFCTPSSTTLCEREIPDTVLGGETMLTYLSNVYTIACGQAQSYALLETGEVVSWGNNSFGQLGDGSYTDRAEPIYVRVEGGDRLQNIAMISAGLTHVYALTNDGYVYAWGNNNKNQLGTGNDIAYSYPQKIVDEKGNSISNIKSISAGGNFGLFLRNDGYVYAVGAYKGTDILANGTRVYSVKKHAEFVSGGETPSVHLEQVQSVSAGYSHAIATVLENNKTYVVAWGNNRFPDITSTHGGQLGIGSTNETQSLSPKYMKRSESIRVENISYIQAGVGVSYIESIDNFFVCGTNSNGQLGTKDYFDRYYMTSIAANVCTPMCSGLNLGGNIEFCSPFKETLETQLSTDDYSFTWLKNNKILIDETNENLTIESVGVYSVYAKDKTASCLPQIASIAVHEKQKDFHIINSSFCTGDLEFKVVGEGDFTWQSTKSGFSLGTGNYINISKFFTEEIIADSIYQVWVTHENHCQSMPVQIVKNCNCNPVMPITIDTTACINRDFFTRAIGDSIIWYTTAQGNNPVHLGAIYHPKNKQIGTHFLYATNITNRCESAIDSSMLELQNCDAWAHISGVIKQEQTPAQYHKVFLIEKHTQSALDSCISDNFGAFTLFSNSPDSVTVFVESTSPHYKNTFLGNKSHAQSAHYVFADSYISNLEIRMLSITQAIEYTQKHESNIIRVEHISIDGKIISIYATMQSYLLHHKSTHSFIRIIYDDGTSQFISILQ